MKENVFDDDLIEKSLQDLTKLWKSNVRSRDYIQIEYGKMDILLSSLKNADEGVMLNTC